MLGLGSKTKKVEMWVDLVMMFKPDIYSSFRSKQCCKTRQRPEMFSGIQCVFFKRRTESRQEK